MIFIYLDEVCLLLAQTIDIRHGGSFSGDAFQGQTG